MIDYNNYGIQFIEFNTDGGTLPADLPEYAAGNRGWGYFMEREYPFSEFVPVKSGSIFVGWYSTNDDNGVRLYDFGYNDYNYYPVYYARYISDVAVDYTSETFTGVWEGTRLNGANVIAVKLTLNADGTYAYVYKRNGVMTANVTGIYRYDGERIILVTCTDGVLQYDASDINISTMFTDDNMLLFGGGILDLNDSYSTGSSGGYRLAYTSVLLIKGAVKPVNYAGKNLAGEYRYYADIRIYDGNELDEDLSEIRVTARANGTAEYTSRGSSHSDTYNYDYDYFERGNVYYRMVGGRFYMIHTNGYAQDVTDMLSSMNKVGADYAGLNVLGDWVAADEQTQLLLPIMSFRADGIVAFSMRSSEDEFADCEVTYGITGANEYLFSLEFAAFFTATYYGGAEERLEIEYTVVYNGIVEVAFTFNYIRAA
jgi:hypothetical protein